jgi:ubiquinone/menaquinone biosynthesis C-methylase UbiE
LAARVELMDEPRGNGEPIRGPKDLSPAGIKQCCAAIYGSDAARLLLGESFHPGGTRLTERLGRILSLGAGTRVLDVAAGTGASAFALATRFGCEVVGIDYSERNIEQARLDANSRGLADRVRFQRADAERLPFPDCSLDAIICECSLCTFPNKQIAVREFARVLRAGGQVGLSDLTRQGVLGPELDGFLSWIACIADAQPLTGYVALLSAANLKVQVTDEHNGALTEFLNRIRTRLLAAEVMAGLQEVSLPGFDFEAAKKIAQHARQAIAEGRLGYAIVTALKSV